MKVFGTTQSGETVHALELGTGALHARVLTYGACLNDLRLAGVDHPLTIGFDHLAPYEGALYHAGTIMGPVANRIAGAEATIDGVRHRFDRNFQGAHTLHGGSAAFHAQVWTVLDHGPDHVHLGLNVPDGAGGFPGNRQITARFEAQDAALTLTLTAQSDAPTLMNLANHSYWNLGPHPTTRGHRLMVQADQYLPSDATTVMPTGEIVDVTGTRFDFRQGRVVTDGDEGLWDTCLCLSDGRGPLRDVARLEGPTGLAMSLATTEPGLQVFDGHILGKGPGLAPYAALALEAQFWPNAPHHPAFPDITLRPGDPWQQVTRWSFSN